jgi:hypothetical protein
MERQKVAIADLCVLCDYNVHIGLLSASSIKVKPKKADTLQQNSCSRETCQLFRQAVPPHLRQDFLLR